VLLLGGIGCSTVSRLASCAAAGIAVMGEAMRAPAPEAWFRALALLWCSIKT
jgi:thiamine monophosphate synthase